MFNHYSFTRLLTSDGKPVHYVSVLTLLDKGSTSKRTILEKVWHVENAYDTNMWRGHMSSLFADMRRKGIASYNTKTRKWSITDKGKDLLENAKREWGKRYAERFWNYNWNHIDDLYIFSF